jgi:uncharacterized membrane protein
MAVVFLCLSLSPSLVPRDWLLQGVVSGISAAIGYGLGVLASHLARSLAPRWREPAPWIKHRSWQGLMVVGPVLVVSAGLLAGGWQQSLHELMGIDDPPPTSYLGTVAVAATLLVLLVLAGRGLRLAARVVGVRLHRWIQHDLAAVLGAVLVGVVVLAGFEGVLLRAMLAAADRSFQAIDEAIIDEVAPPDDPWRSGGPGSHVTWEDLGLQGRAFVHRVSDVEQLRELNGRVEAAPIRVYAGLQSAAAASERAAVAVAELERTGAFDREVLVVAGATGRGWINPLAAAAIEHLYDGDTAIASMQYSYQPSWVSFLADRERAAEAGTELFEQVHEAWSARPADERPRLFVYGESLGSLAMESGFADVDDLRERTDGALFVGPPNLNPLWREQTRSRAPDSPQRLPVVDDGLAVRFAAEPEDFSALDGPWEPPRVAYLQHASDPVVWWSPRLIVQRPDWLAEARGPDVLPQMRWSPFVTFWQLSADLAHADDVPPGHGHDYGTHVLDGWLAVAPPDDWDDETTERLRTLLERLRDEYR